MLDPPPSDAHPLDGIDPWECYDQLISERNKLISAKREAEDGFVKTIVQLSSAIILAVPGFLAFNKVKPYAPSPLLLVGLALIGLSLISALCEQYLSSHAYDRQIAKTDAYYTKASNDISPPTVSKFVRVALTVAFVGFVTGVCIISLALLVGPWRK